MRRFDEIEIAAGNETPNHGVAKTSQFNSHLPEELPRAIMLREYIYNYIKIKN